MEGKKREKREEIDGNHVILIADWFLSLSLSHIRCVFYLSIASNCV